MGEFLGGVFGGSFLGGIVGELLSIDMHNKEICYGWLVFCKKFLINSWKFVLKIKYGHTHHYLEFSRAIFNYFQKRAEESLFLFIFAK